MNGGEIKPFEPRTAWEHTNVLRGYLGGELTKGRMTGEQVRSITRQLDLLAAAHHKEMHGEGSK